jgi:AcrR family transcriptional regulator
VHLELLPVDLHAPHELRRSWPQLRARLEGDGQAGVTQRTDPRDGRDILEWCPPAMARAEPTRREEILEAALQCFLEQGYDATTIQDVRAKSGASIGSIYHAFQGKAQIAAALLAETLGDWQRSLLRRLEKESTAEGLIRAIVDHYVSWVARSPDRARFLLHAPRGSLDAEAAEDVKARNAELLRKLKALLGPHMASKAIRPLPTSLFIPIVIGPSMEWARAWLGGRSKASPNEAKRVLADAAWAAVRG